MLRILHIGAPAGGDPWEHEELEAHFVADLDANAEVLAQADAVLVWPTATAAQVTVAVLRQACRDSPIPILLVVSSASDVLPDGAADALVDSRWSAAQLAWSVQAAVEHVRLGAHVTQIQRDALAMVRAEARTLYQRAVHDDLTGLFNRRHYEDVTPREHQRAVRGKHCYALAVIDLDDLKLHNSRHGHAGGSAALRLVADLISAVKRRNDYAFRFGGDEFVVLLTECDKPGALLFAARLVAMVEAKRLVLADQEVQISISVGVASFPQDGATPEAVFERADAALFAAKAGGKSRALPA